MAANYDNLIESLARHFWGEPNEQHSKPGELRFGTNGSKSIDLEKNAFYDHEAADGGGVIKLVQFAAGIESRKAAHQWLVDKGFIGGEHIKTAKVVNIPPAHQVMEVMQVMAADKKEPKTAKTPAKIVATYDYRDEQNELVMQVVRMEPKTFRQRRPDGNGWDWKVKGVRVLPYRLPELLAAPAAVVYIVEGEKDADRLAALGLTATCNAGGAGKWGTAHAQFLRARRVVILPDNDEAGAKHAQKVLKSLKGVASDVRVINLPGLPDKGDVSDWLDAGGTAEDLEGMAAAPTPEPAAAAPGEEDDARKPSQTDLLVKFAKERFSLIHDKNGDTYARDTHTGEVRRLGSRQFKDRITAAFYQQCEIAVRDQSWREAVGTLQALARFEGEPQDIHIRVAGHDGVYFVDLCQPGNSRAIEISKDGWSIVNKAPVLFVRGESMQPLPDPASGGSMAGLWDIANIPENLRLLVVTWLIDSMRLETPFPGLELIGEQGSGKSTAAEALRRLIDPSGCNLRGAPKTVEDIFVGAGHNWVVAYENVSHLAGPMQDALAILSTGGGFAKRQLYTDSEEHVINVRRPWLINGISVSVTQQDLVDRVISVECPVIESRQSSSKQWQDFERALPSILGGLYDLAVKALSLLPRMNLPREDRPRLVEYVLLGMAVAQAAGDTPNKFLKDRKSVV